MAAKNKCSMCNRSAVSRGLCDRHLRSSWHTPKRKTKPARKKPKTVRVINPFYRSKAWRELSAQQLESHPICARCNSMNVIRAAVHADHVKPVSKFPDLKLEQSNLQSLCQTCHNTKTANERKGIYYDYARGIAYENYE